MNPLYLNNRAVRTVGFLSKRSLGTGPLSGRYRDPRPVPRPRGLVPKLASSRDRGPTISEADRQLEHELDSPHITARA